MKKVKIVRWQEANGGDYQRPPRLKALKVTDCGKLVTEGGHIVSDHELDDGRWVSQSGLLLTVKLCASF